MTLALVAIIGLALAFDYINGFHDAANSIATVVSTRVLSPRIAVLWAAFFNFVAFLVFETRVASGIAKGVDPAVATLTIVGAGLVGAIVWDLLTWWWELPTSSSHALLGGLAGAAVVKAGFGALDAPFFVKTAAFIVVSPALGMLLAIVVMHGLIYFLGHRAPGPLDRLFRKLQLVSAALYSLGHGGNDAQKTMGIIVAALAAAGLFQHAPAGSYSQIPLWVVLAASGISGLGSSMFFPSNNSAVMANAPPGSYGGISGVLRTVQNIGILGSFVIAITVASASIPRNVAFEVFIGTTNLAGGVSEEFLRGIDASLWASIVIMGIAAVLSWMRGREVRPAGQ